MHWVKKDSTLFIWDKTPDIKDYISPNATKCMLAFENHTGIAKKEKWFSWVTI